MVWYALVAVVVVLLDQLSKAVIVGNFRLYEVKAVIPGFFNLVHVQNPGAAFSLLADMDSPWRHYFFVVISLVAVAGLSWYYFSCRNEIGVAKAALAVGLLAGGAVGNLIDRVRLGVVTDFLDFYYGSWHWPAFNVADSAICVGAALLIIFNIFPAKENKGKKQKRI